MSTVQDIHGVPVMLCPADGDVVGSERDALDLIGNAFYQEAQWIVIPAERLGETFFQLRSRVAGEIIQKFVNYRIGLAVVGDISVHTDASAALRDFVRECNAGRQTWFVGDIAEFQDRLARYGVSSGRA